MDRASVGRKKRDRDWRLSRTDGLYRAREVNETRLCLRKWMVGCSGPTGMVVCDSKAEACAESEAPYDEGLRVGKYSICSEAAFMSPSTVTLVFTIPLALLLTLLVASGAALYHTAHSGLCGCPTTPVRLSVLLASPTLLLFAVQTFFSPYFGTGVVGGAVGVVALVTHSVVATETDELHYQGRESAVKAQRWLGAAAAGTLAAVYLTWGHGYPMQAGLSELQLGQGCADFYQFFVVDPRLRAPDQSRDVRFWGYCDKEYVSDTTWNVAAVLWLSLSIGALHAAALAGVTRRVRQEEESPISGGERPPLVTPHLGASATLTGRQIGVPFTIEALRSRSEPSRNRGTSPHSLGGLARADSRRVARLVLSESYQV
eukprot:Hpha_TRINITY_DN16533_c1_g10::TRINITY_DN16533_c1_g10_i1::g.132501::m.132501